MFRRTICYVLAALLLIGLLPLAAYAEGNQSELMASVIDQGTYGSNLTWILSSDGTLTIRGSGDMSGYKIYNYPWHPYRDSIRAVVIQQGVTSIGSCAFCDCSSLTSVTIPDSVTSIGSQSFDGCSSLTSVAIPAGVTIIGDGAFRSCSSLTSVAIPAGVTSIGMAAFSGCSSLTSVTIPAGMTSINPMVFYGCTALKDVYYKGTRTAWNKITISYMNEPLLQAALHCLLEISFVKGPNGEMLYYEDGEPVPSKYGFVDYGGSKFLVANGRIVTTKSGLARDPEHPEDWYFLSHGQVQTQHTGLTQYDGEWFYVENGKLDTTLSAVVEYNGGLFLVARGRLLQDKNGLGQDPVTHIWYYFSHGQVQTQFTGLAQYDGKWFYVQKGVFDSTFNGEITYKNRRYLIRNGTMVQEIK